MTDYESIYDDAYTESCCINNTGPLLHLGPRTIDHDAGVAAVVAAAKSEARDEGESELSKFGDPAELLDIAVMAGKLGLTVDDIEPMARNWYLAQSRFQQLAQRAEEFATELRGTNP